MAEHELSEIDLERRTAVCSVCGSTDIRTQTVGKYSYVRCANKEREYTRKYRRNHYSSKLASPRAHVLSQIDEENKTAICSQCGPVEIYIWKGKRKIGRRCCNAGIRRGSPALETRQRVNATIIDRYMAEHGCQRCGYNGNPVRLSLYTRRLQKTSLNIEKLTKLTPNQLMQKLEKCEVLCQDCSPWSGAALTKKNRISLGMAYNDANETVRDFI